MGMIRPSLMGAAPSEQQQDGQADATHAAMPASSAQDNLAAVLSLQRMCPGMPMLAPAFLAHQPPNYLGLPQSMDSLCRQVPVGGFVGLHGLGMLQPVTYDALADIKHPTGGSAAGSGSNKHKQVRRWGLEP